MMGYKDHNDVVTHRCPEFRQANSVDTPEELLISLSGSKDELIRGAIALNPSTPNTVLDVLFNDKSDYVLSCLRKRGYKPHPIFYRPKAIIGNNLILRDATAADAAFILELRTHEKKSTHISKTNNDVRQQEAWLDKYKNDGGQVYFIILNNEESRVGTVRLYDIKGDSFSWGSWILKEGVPSTYSVESALLVYHFALSLGFKKAHFSVRKENISVWRFHERFGARKISESINDFSYSISHHEIKKSLEKYKRYLPKGFLIETFGEPK